jgi:hypothetical protein
MSGMPPPKTMLAPSSLALAYMPRTFFWWILLTRGPILVSGSKGRPGFIFGLLLQGGDELVEDRALDVDALGAQADLAGVLEAGAGDGGDGVVEVAVGEHQRAFLPPSSRTPGGCRRRRPS